MDWRAPHLLYPGENTHSLREAGQQLPSRSHHPACLGQPQGLTLLPFCQIQGLPGWRAKEILYYIFSGDAERKGGWKEQGAHTGLGQLPSKNVRCGIDGGHTLPPPMVQHPGRNSTGWVRGSYTQEDPGLLTWCDHYLGPLPKSESVFIIPLQVSALQKGPGFAHPLVEDTHASQSL